ncbi:MAG: c-type cytochrome, partial [Myxococcota bacterium]
MRRYLPLIFLAACVGDSDDPVTPGPIADCVPDEAAYEATVRPLIEANCARCHGTSPNFGAPFSLLTYAPLLEGQEGGRIVDEIVREVQSGSMPPAGAPDPSAEERATIVEWASCGAETVSSPLEPTRPPFTSPNDPPPDLETIDLVAADLAVGPDVKDRYNDIDFTNLTDEDVFIRRFDAIVDESRVLHHLTLRRGDPALGEINMKYLYAWAPGTGAIEFPDGGIRLRPGDNLRLQIHYNNGAELEDIRDSSGVRLFVGEPSGREYEMFDPGPGALGFQIGARSSATITSTCTMREDAEMIAAMPHMHEIGTAFDMLVRRGGGDMESVLQLPTWDFESQLFYELPLDLQTGDELTIRCDYDNASSDTVVAGPRTEDEMCFAFAYVTPPPTQAFLCTETPIGDATEL